MKWNTFSNEWLIIRLFPIFNLIECECGKIYHSPKYTNLDDWFYNFFLDILLTFNSDLLKFLVFVFASKILIFFTHIHLNATTEWPQTFIQNNFFFFFHFVISSIHFFVIFFWPPFDHLIHKYLQYKNIFMDGI